MRGIAGLISPVARRDMQAMQTLPLAPPFSNMTHADWSRSVRLWLEHGAPLVSTLPYRPCPACGGARATPLFTSYDGYPFHECDACASWFVPKQVDTAVYDAFFATCPEAAALAAQMTERREQTLAAADIKRIGEYLDELLAILAADRAASLRYLDTGCGVGHSLEAARQRGLHAHGIEVDRPAIEAARSKGLSVTEPDEPAPGSYRLMTFLETLEHINDPLAALQKYVPLLDPGGLVTITVPNLASPAVRLLRGDCSYVHGGTNTPGHINLFHIGALTRLLERAGLVVLDADAQYSNNPMELAGYLLGRSRAVRDMLTNGSTAVQVPDLLVQVLNAAWPGVALLERLALTAPILKVVACRPEDVASFAEPIADLQRRRRTHIEDQAEQLLGGAPDYKSLAAQLQEEVNVRDRMLQELQAKRGRLLRGLKKQIKRWFP